MSENIKNDKEKNIVIKEKEEHNPLKKREVIKTLLIIFLALLLVLTFFSNTIMNRSLSEITTETASSGKLTERVRGSGMVVSNQTYEVTVDTVNVVEKINIKSGQKVKKNDVLFSITAENSTELTDAEAALDTLELEYRKALLSEPVDYSTENQAIKNAREDLNLAIAKRDQVYNNQANVEQAKAQYLSDKREVTELSNRQSKLSGAVTAIDSDEYSAAAPEYTGNLIALYSAYTTAEAEYSTAYSLYTQAVSDGADEGVVNTAKADADAKQIVRDSAKSAYIAEKTSVRSDLVAQLAEVESELTAVSDRVTEYESNSENNGMTYEDCVADVQATQCLGTPGISDCNG